MSNIKIFLLFLVVGCHQFESSKPSESVETDTINIQGTLDLGAIGQESQNVITILGLNSGGASSSRVNSPNTVKGKMVVCNITYPNNPIFIHSTEMNLEYPETINSEDNLDDNAGLQIINSSLPYSLSLPKTAIEGQMLYIGFRKEQLIEDLNNPGEMISTDSAADDIFATCPSIVSLPGGIVMQIGEGANDRIETSRALLREAFHVAKVINLQQTTLTSTVQVDIDEDTTMASRLVLSQPSAENRITTLASIDHVDTSSTQFFDGNYKILR